MIVGSMSSLLGASVVKRWDQSCRALAVMRSKLLNDGDECELSSMRRTWHSANSKAIMVSQTLPRTNTPTHTRTHTHTHTHTYTHTHTHTYTHSIIHTYTRTHLSGLSGLCPNSLV